MNSIFPGIPHTESPLFHATIDNLGLSDDERRVAIDLNERGYAVIDFPDEEIDRRIQRIGKNLGPRFGIDFANPLAGKHTGEQRIQDAWLIDEDVRAIAANGRMLTFLQKLYGRRAFPFQTLNFPVGTQQHLHSDSNHFSSIPERFMCGVWLAFEDVHPAAGPLTYLPGSHKWPIVTNLMIGRKAFGAQPESAQAPFEAAWDAMVSASKVEPEVFLARKGQALIWSANLLHGGSLRLDRSRTRWSQVTHYYFDDCIYYTPAFSDEAIGQLDIRKVRDIATGEWKQNRFFGETFSTIAPGSERPSGKSTRRWWQIRNRDETGLPPGFDPVAYLIFNPDVAAARMDPVQHYLSHGAREGRRFCR